MSIEEILRESLDLEGSIISIAKEIKSDTLKEILRKSLVSHSARLNEAYQLIADNPQENSEWLRTMNRDIKKITETLEIVRKRYMMITI